MSKAGCTLSHFSGVNASSPMSDTIPQGCQIPPVPLVLPEHSLCKERRSHPALKLALSEGNMKLHEEKTIGRKTEGTMQVCFIR